MTVQSRRAVSPAASARHRDCHPGWTMGPGDGLEFTMRVERGGRTALSMRGTRITQATARLNERPGILLGRPQDSAGLPAAEPGETWGTAVLVTADSGLVHSACDSH